MVFLCAIYWNTMLNLLFCNTSNKLRQKPKKKSSFCLFLLTWLSVWECWYVKNTSKVERSKRTNLILPQKLLLNFSLLCFSWRGKGRKRIFVEKHCWSFLIFLELIKKLDSLRWKTNLSLKTLRIHLNWLGIGLNQFKVGN